MTEYERFLRLRSEGTALQAEIRERAYLEQVWEVVLGKPMDKVTPVTDQAAVLDLIAP